MAKIERLPSGLYRIRLYLGKDASGKKKYKSLTHKDKRKLATMADSYLDLHKDYMDSEAFSKHLDAYINEREAVLSPATVRAYQSIADKLKNDYSAFCALDIGSIQSRDVQKVVDGLVKDDKSPKTVQNYVGLISSTLKYAGRSLPAVKLPEKRRTAYTIPDEKTARKIAQDASGTKLEIPIALAMLGLRRGEICGLTLSDLDGCTLHIHATKVYNKKQVLVDKPTPKNYSSDRYIQIPQQIADKIREQGYITELTPAGLSEAFTYFINKHGYPHIRLHDLRHFFVSYCHNILKLSDAQIMKLGGWKTAHVMRSVYLQSMEDSEANKAVVDFADGILCHPSCHP
jgi:integrase